MVTYMTNWYKMTIFDSCLVPSKNFLTELNEVKNKTAICPLWDKRSMWSLRCEWAVHNLCYKLKIKRDKTKDVDFEYEQKWYLSLAYYILGTIVMPFV